MPSKLFNNKQSADVAFEVKGQVFHAHKVILSWASKLPIMWMTSVIQITLPIEDVESELVEQIVKHAYCNGEEIPLNTWKAHGKEIFIASGKYGFNALWADAESRYIIQTKLTLDNSINELLYADGNNLVKLKEVEYMVKHMEELTALESFERLYQSKKLNKEVMVAACKKPKYCDM